MSLVIRQPDAPRDGAKCPRCANTQGIKDGGPGLRRRRAYDVLHDTFGLLRCPHCGYKAYAAEFRKPVTTK
jgi:predicted nucleic-acid-binding Zn-ribbon protein